jgi:hypothetical protein
VLLFPLYLLKLIATALQLMCKKALQLFLSMLVWKFLTVCNLSHSEFYAIFFFSFSAGCGRILFFNIFLLQFSFFISLLSSHLSAESGLIFLLFDFSFLSCFFCDYFHTLSLFCIFILFCNIFTFSRLSFGNVLSLSVNGLFLPASLSLF